ncbi:pyridoxal-dependent decarboxylase [Fodinicola feengrottensis]|uniref:pyridoxal-dependent decarboxylase n=1 Tax=Fodinicola feengrottensis TaxID=435914 RepID=UPI0036F26F81
MIDYRDWHAPLGRRFRSLKLWSVIRWYGAEGMRAHVRSGVALAEYFAGLVEADDRFEKSSPTTSFRWCASDCAARTRPTRSCSAHSTQPASST